MSSGTARDAQRSSILGGVGVGTRFSLLSVISIEHVHGGEMHKLQEVLLHFEHKVIKQQDSLFQLCSIVSYSGTSL